MGVEVKATEGWLSILRPTEQQWSQEGEDTLQSKSDQAPRGSFIHVEGKKPGVMQSRIL